MIDLGPQELLYALEIHITPHVKRIGDQLLRHFQALEFDAVAETFDASASNFVLTVHDQQTTLEKTRQRLMIEAPDFARHADAFLFNTIDQVRADISTGWTYADGSHATPFPSPE